MSGNPLPDMKEFTARGESLSEFVAKLTGALSEVIIRAQSSHLPHGLTESAPGNPQSNARKDATIAADGSFIVLDHELTRFTESQSGPMLLLFRASMRGQGVPASKLSQFGEMRYVFKRHEWWNTFITKTNDEDPAFHLKVDGVHLTLQR